MSGRSRGQLVLAAAAVLAVALMPIVFAYLQLGYHEDVRASDGYTAPGENAERVLSRAVHQSATDVPAEYDWDERRDAVDRVRSRLDPQLQQLRSARVEGGTVYRVAYNQSATSDWAARNCPSGPNRQFGACTADRGVVVQNRAGQTHVLAVAFDVRIVTERGQMELVLVVETVS